MRFQANKTWSQQQLAVKLGVDETVRTGFFSWERKRFLIHITKTALAAALCWWLAQCVGLHDGYWGSISAIIVLQSNFGATVTASRNRLLGTLIGALVGFSCTLFGTPPWNFALALMAAMTICALLGLHDSSRLAGVTICVVMLVHSHDPQWRLALLRVTEVFLGIVVAIAVSTLVFPDRARLRLREGLAQEFLLLSAYFEAVLQGFSGTPADNLPSLHNGVLAKLRANNQLLEASRNEPSGGPGWREGLEMLSQFGRSLLDLLTALELAVKDSHKDGYALQLEPTLGKLAQDISSGFRHVAGCIDSWCFNIAPPGINLEEDIAELEARMNAVRPKGIEFSQAEILRAYAVQLHLKQIARLLKASRVETSRATGEMEEPLEL